MSDTLQYDRRSYDGQDIACIRKKTLEFYFSNCRICTADGESVDSAELVDSAQLVDLTYELLLNGTASCTHVTDGYAYTLTLDQDGMSSLAAAIAPSISEQDVSFASGYIEARVSEDGTLEAVSVSCSGALHLILTDAPAAVSATLTPAAREFSFSQQALTALKQSRGKEEVGEIASSASAASSAAAATRSRSKQRIFLASAYMKEN